MSMIMDQLSNLGLYFLLCFELLLLRARKAEDICSNLSHLDFFCTLSDPVASEVAINVFEGIVPGVSVAAVDLICQSAVFHAGGDHRLT